MHIRLATVAALLFGSGLSALVYQTVWQKSFRFVFGASGEASAAVLGIFLGGLGLGGALLGRRAEKARSPLVLYGNLELMIAVLAAGSPFWIEGLTNLYAHVGGSRELGRGGATLLRLLLATVAIGPAAFLMGGTLPAAARAAVAEDDSRRRGLAKIYALNTSGAVLGALVGPLLLFGAIGTRLTLWLAVCVNLLVGITARIIGRRQVLKAGEPASAQKAKEEDTAGQIKPQVVYFLAALVGFVFLYMELIWFRMLAPILGGSTVTFGLILAVALAGIGIGGWLYSAQKSNAKMGLHVLVITLSLEALFIALPFAWGDDLALIAAHLRSGANLGYSHLLMGWLLVTSIVVLPTSIVSGYQFPVIFALLGQGRSGVAKEVGTAYAFNTVGTLSGSLMGGFLLIPLLGATTSWRYMPALLLVAAALAAIVCFRSLRSWSLGLLLALPIVLCAPLLFADGPGVVWRHSPIGAGRVDISKMNPNQLKAMFNDKNRQLIFEEDGVEATVGVDAGNSVSFLVNGKSDGSVYGDRGTQIMLALIPGAVHPAPKRSFVVGLGTGTTAGMLGLIPSMETVDVAEIEQAITEVARLTGPANGDALNNPKLNLMLGDARELLLGRDAPYDIIVSEPSNPYRIGVSTLFTQEFYQLSASSLNDDGIFAQWIQGYEIDAYTLSTAVRTLRSVFKEVDIWSTQNGDLVLLASQLPMTLKADRLRKTLSQEPFLTWFARSRSVEGLEAFVAQQMIANDKLTVLFDRVAGTINVDDLNVMEHAFARSVGKQTRLAHQLRSLVLGYQLSPEVIGHYDKHKVHTVRSRLFPRLQWPGDAPNVATQRGCMGSFGKDATAWPSEKKLDVGEHWVRGIVLGSAGDDLATEDAQALLQRGFSIESHTVSANLELTKNDLETATKHLLTAVQKLREEPLPLCASGQKVLDLSLSLAKRKGGAEYGAQLFDAIISAPFAAYIFEGARQRNLVSLAMLLGPKQTMDPARCVAALELVEPYPFWNEKTLRDRAECYQAAGHGLADVAARDFDVFQELEPIRYLGDDPFLPHKLPEQMPQRKN